VSWSERNDDIIEVIKDKERYVPGDTIKLIVKSPYEKCKALVTIEREAIIDKFVMDVNTSMPVIEIPVKSEFLPNVYVSVVLLKGRTLQDFQRDPEGKLGKPSFKLGYINIPVDPGEMKLKVDFDGVKEKYQPGDAVEFELSSLNADKK